jgi:two-component system, NarL family, sensor histidine kinase DevS
LKGPENQPDDLPQINNLALFHICQEALGNAAKHSGANHIDINLFTASDRVVMEIHDNGTGFAVEKMSTTIGHGLSNMQTRAHAVGGDVEITSAPGEGTTILAWVPRGSKH